MKTKWKKFDDEIQELKLTDWVEANVFDPSKYNTNPKDWAWSVDAGYKELIRGNARTESLAKRAAKRELIRLFRQLGEALDYDVE